VQTVILTEALVPRV